MERVCLKGKKILILCVSWRAVRSLGREGKTDGGNRNFQHQSTKILQLGQNFPDHGRATSRFGGLQFIGESCYRYPCSSLRIAIPRGPSQAYKSLMLEGEYSYKSLSCLAKAKLAKLTFSRWLTIPKHLVINFSTGVLNFFGFKICN